jgi:endogenous inhibitor of DNA gyrase (YacG/DUF329 family)
VVKRKCPTCGRAFEPSEETRPFRPFCSARCRAADLGKWLDGGYRIPSHLSDEVDESDLGAGAADPDDPTGTSKLPH